MTESSTVLILVGMITAGGAAWIGILKNKTDITANKIDFQEQIDSRLRIILEASDKQIEYYTRQIAEQNVKIAALQAQGDEIGPLKLTVAKLEAALAAEIERRQLAEIGLDVADLRILDTNHQIQIVSEKLSIAQAELEAERAMKTGQAERIRLLERRVRELESEVNRLKTVDNMNGENI